MIQIALKLRDLTLQGLKDLAAAIKAGLTGNASFASPNPSPANIQTGIDNLTTAQNELSTAEAAVVLKRQAVEDKAEALRGILRASAANCQDVVKNDTDEVARTKLLSANFPLKSDGAPGTPDMTPPQSFFVNRGDHDGAVDGGCDRVTGAKMYRVRHGASMSGPWATGYEGTKSSFTINALAAGERWFQMQAFVGGAWTEWSDPARCVVV